MYLYRGSASRPPVARATPFASISHATNLKRCPATRKLTTPCPRPAGFRPLAMPTQSAVFSGRLVICGPLRQRRRLNAISPLPSSRQRSTKALSYVTAPATKLALSTTCGSNPTTGQLQGFVLRVGGTIQTMFGGGEAQELDRSQVERVDEGTVYLRLDKNEIMRSAS